MISVLCRPGRGKAPLPKPHLRPITALTALSFIWIHVSWNIYVFMSAKSRTYWVFLPQPTLRHSQFQTLNDMFENFANKVFDKQKSRLRRKRLEIEFLEKCFFFRRFRSIVFRLGLHLCLSSIHRRRYSPFHQMPSTLTVRPSVRRSVSPWRQDTAPGCLPCLPWEAVAIDAETQLRWRNRHGSQHLIGKQYRVNRLHRERLTIAFRIRFRRYRRLDPRQTSPRAEGNNYYSSE